MANPATVPTFTRSASERLETAAPSRETLNSLRHCLLDPALDAQGVLELADAILALQRASLRS